MGISSSDLEDTENSDKEIMEAERRRRRGTRSGRFSFPPPISSLSCNGNPVFVLKAVRKDGRLRISREWINRPEILRADCCTQINRLRLFVVKANSQTRDHQHDNERHDSDNEEEAVAAVAAGAVAEEEAKRWRLAVCGNVEGFQRCNGKKQEMSLWNQQCLATT
ncbi:hypothetical protein Syun_029030 [Stephania yunnanensis]|uniref:FAF domain-containing protein n=1 Tax=Stephania yunnanensis TaxID=152371 RepID=A0AAP0E4S2_9MAGN